LDKKGMAFLDFLFNRKKKIMVKANPAIKKNRFLTLD
jgi:hypothetical protein